jgi:hypothetical protein
VADAVVVNGTAGDATISVAAANGGAEASGIGSAVVRVTGAELAYDSLRAAGQGGSDTLEIVGGSGPDTIGVFANGSDASVVADGFGNVRVDTTDETVRLVGGEGADTLSATGNLAAITSLVLDGGEGADTLLGGNGVDLLLGGAGADTLDGNQASDSVFGGAGDDVFTWDPGDGSDTLEGGLDADRLAFNGANIGELFDVSANGGRVRFTRNIATIVMDLDDIERLDVRALGGADTATVNDLSGTDLGLVVVDLAAFGGAGDGVADAVVVNGTAGDDTISVAAANGGAEASGIGSAVVRVTGAELALDMLTVNGLAGDNTIAVDPAVTGLIGVVANP